MAYLRNTYRFRNAIEVEEYHSGRYGAPGEKRRQKKKPTPEQMERINQLNKEKLCRRKLRTHFDVKDYFVTMTYRKEERPPDMKEAKTDWRKFIRHVRREYGRRGETLKWIRNIECGSRGAWHIHFVINRIPDADVIIRDAWQKGKVIFELLYARGEFRELAAYITKTPKTDRSLSESDYSASRNLPVKKPERKVITRWATWKDDPRIPKGFFLDKESMRQGINQFGFPYRSYTLLRVRRC